ncbi:MAG: hypothetical protein GWP06_15385 [Actinobacteria bacterium]|nr:hypothetical protein [Actinomycetota bacterium]
MKKPLLNSSQKNSLQVSLRMLEEKLLTMEMLLENRTMRGELYSFHIDLEEDEIKNLKNIFIEMHKLIAEMKHIFNFGDQKEFLSNQLAGMSAYYWTVFMDETSKKLKRYGDVSPQLENILDPMIEKFVYYIEQLATIKKGDTNNEQN